MRRRGGGHVGVVSGFDRRGNPVIIAGIAGGRPSRVREYPVPRARVWRFVRAI
jgi:hypothetical protein